MEFTHIKDNVVECKIDKQDLIDYNNGLSQHEKSDEEGYVKGCRNDGFIGNGKCWFFHTFTNA